jgi:hypothetical protein
MNTQTYIQQLSEMAYHELRDEVAKNDAEALSLSGSAQKLAEYKLHLSREELSRR